MTLIERGLNSFIYTCAAALLLLSQASFAKNADYSEIQHNCQNVLLRQEQHRDVVARFYQTTISELPDDRGFELSWKGSSKVRKAQDADELLNPPRYWPQAVWRHPGQPPYLFMNLGFKNLEDDSDGINGLVYDHLKRFPGHGLQFLFSEERAHSAALARELRWTIHEHVLNIYHNRKGYLSPDDFETLNAVNRYSSNSDVLVVFKNREYLDLNNLDPETLVADLAATIQVSYHGDRQYFTPTLRGILMSAGVEPDDEADLFPFEYRMEPGERAKFRKTLAQAFDLNRTCELTRYAHFGYVPTSVTNRLVLEAVNLAKERGMKTIVASVDRATVRLFSQLYGFRAFSRIFTDSGTEEYLIYMNLDSDVGKILTATLTANSKELSIEREGKRWP